LSEPRFATQMTQNKRLERRCYNILFMFWGRKKSKQTSSFARHMSAGCAYIYTASDGTKFLPNLFSAVEIFTMKESYSQS